MQKQFTVLLILFFILGLIPINFSNATDLSTKLKGRILLQVESNGEAWYINPDNEKRYYLGRPDDAFQIMRELGLGISNKDFDSFNGYAPSRLSGKILLKVEDNGKAYYVNPTDLKMYYLGRPTDAFQIMRKLGLGISNADLSTINITENLEDLKINDLLSAVGEIVCIYKDGIQKGSGIIWGDYILTNRHVIETSDPNLKECSFFIYDDANKQYGIFKININELIQYNPYADFAGLKIGEDNIANDDSPLHIKDKSQLNQNAKKLKKCSNKVAVGTKVYIIGFPKFADKNVVINGYNADQQSQILSEGIISGYDSSLKIPSGNLPYDNYYVSNDIDSGNSGGLAVAEENGVLCFLGIPTWVSEGNYATQGIVQNMYNIAYKE